jgi:ubiquinone/menaquinone biosynthesis C-methylase UbiE
MFFAHLFKMFFWLLYHQLAWGYDLVAAIVSVGQWNHWAASAISQISGKRVLEIGFGPGHIQKELLSQGYQSFGLDESWQMTKIARQRLKKLTSKQYVQSLVRSKAQAIPFSTGYFDSVISTFPSEYIFDVETLSEISRILNKQGKLVIVLSVSIRPTNILQHAAAWLFRQTGQSIEKQSQRIQKSLLDHFSNTDLYPSIQWAAVANVDVLLIQAFKSMDLTNVME